MAVEDGGGVFSRSITQLVSLLRTSFRSKEFDEVEEILVAREVKFKKEVKKKEKENEFLGSKLEVMRLEKMTVEAELQELREKAEELLNVIDTDSSEAVKRYEKSSEEAEKKRESELNQKTTKFEIGAPITNKYSELGWDELVLWKKEFEEKGSQDKKLSNMIKGEAKVSKNIGASSENGENSASAGGAKVIDVNEKKQMAVAGNGHVSPGIIVKIMDSDDECPGKALCVKRNSSGKLDDSRWTSVELHKRKHDPFDKSTRNEFEADDQNDINLGSYLMWKPREIVANTDNLAKQFHELIKRPRSKRVDRNKAKQGAGNAKRTQPNSY